MCLEFCPSGYREEPFLGGCLTGICCVPETQQPTETQQPASESGAIFQLPK
ncbi:MAG: hypothetical protein QXP53_00440 [Candidatus Pacearchaeota archaeon]